jgi:hypothetical protein
METIIIAHIANIVQRCLEDNLTDFIPKDEWPSSPDLNSLDFSIWGYMLGMESNIRIFEYSNIKTFKYSIFEYENQVEYSIEYSIIWIEYSNI